MDKLFVIKIGGQIVDEEKSLSAFIHDFAKLDGYKILVHGGGKMATRLADKLQVPQQMIQGRRVTDAETLKIITMVYAGLINKTIVAALQAEHCNAAGLSGADGDLIRAHKRNSEQDYGFAGDVDEVNTDLLIALLQRNIVPVICPLTHNGKGQLLNTNADTIAQETAKALSDRFKTILIYGFEKAGVLEYVEDENSVIPIISRNDYLKLKDDGKISDGMIPKMDNAFEAIEHGVHQVIIGSAGSLQNLIDGKKGTTITA